MTAAGSGKPAMAPVVVDEVLDTLAPTVAKLAGIILSEDVKEDDKRRLVGSAYLHAASSGMVELLEWLLKAEATSLNARSYFDINAEDSDGCPALILASAFGHSDAARIIVEAGGDKDCRDARGWTALMWAFQTGNLPLCSYLINRRACTTLRSHAGLAAIDLIRPGSAGDVFRDVLVELAKSDPYGRTPPSQPTPPFEAAHTHVDLVSKNGRRMTRSVSTASRRDSRMNLAQRKEQALISELAAESSYTLDLDVSLMSISAADLSFATANPGLGLEDVLSDDARDAEDISTASEEESFISFDWEDCLSEQMLSFSSSDLPALLELATNIRPDRAEQTRFLPASVLFLATRYASRYGGQDLTADLLIGAMDRIETTVMAARDDLATSAYWLSNTLLLLYYLRKDPHTEQSTYEHQRSLQELIQQVFVYCIRNVERRLDRILDAAMLEHSALPGFDETRFEDEWRFVRAFTGRHQKQSSLGYSPATRQSVTGLFTTPEKPTCTPPNGSPGSPRKLQRGRTPSVPASLSSMAASPHASPNPSLTPSSVASIFTSTLFVLQQYDLAGQPCIVVQAFSQLLYWLASELFNRILAKKRYLCRSRAVQIRLNVSWLEDWARTNRLPMQMVTAHFRPLNELLQWLQCLSSEDSIDGLLATCQNLRNLNPCQMRKAVKEYRYEVDESKMSEECSQYLAQLQKDWEKRQMLRILEPPEARSLASSSRSSLPLSTDGESDIDTDETSRTSEPRSTVERHIDDIFGCGLVSYMAYEPPERPEATGDKLNSNVMLPFALPLNNEALAVYQINAFGPLRKTVDATHPLSTPMIKSYSQVSTLCDPASAPIPALPDDFLMRLEALKRHFGHAPSTAHTALSLTSVDKDEYWFNWRARLEAELQSVPIDAED